MFNIDEILKAVRGRLLSGDKKDTVAGISIDSRTIKPKGLFIAIKGRRFDGHDFVADAVRKGACGVVLSQGEADGLRRTAVIKVKDTLMALGDIAAYHRRRFNIPVIGITGSNGKTTVKEMIWHILGKKFNVLKNKGTENNLIGLPLTLLGLENNYSVAVLEMGANQPGEIMRLTEILKPTVGLITNIGPSHLEFLKDKKGVLRAKSEMVHKLRMSDLLVINGDDAMLSGIRPRCKTIRFGLKNNNDFRAANIRSNGYISFVLNDLYPLKINLLGMHNVYNALAAIAVSLQFGVDVSIIRGALLDFKTPSMRMEFKDINGIKIIDDAYNSNPLSLKQAVQTFSDFKAKGKKILVSGDMLELGKRSRYFHETAGRLIAKASIDALITVGELSRHTALAAGRAGMKRENLWSCNGPEEAADLLRQIAKPGDAVLIKGSRAIVMERIIDNLSNEAVAYARESWSH